MMDDLIRRQAAIDALTEDKERIDAVLDSLTLDYNTRRLQEQRRGQIVEDIETIKELPSAQPERTEYFPDTIAISSQSDCVRLSEKVTATFFDAEYEEWTQKTVTIADVLDSVCDEYTVLPSAQPDIVRCKDCKHYMNEFYFTCRFHISTVGENDFCSHGERRVDDVVD